MIVAAVKGGPSQLVVPAKAGTHNHRRRRKQTVVRLSKNTDTEGMGPRFRGDDTECTAAPSREATAPVAYFIGQTASATAPCGG